MCMCLCFNASVLKIIEVFSPVNDEFDEFQYNMKVYRHAYISLVFHLIIQFPCLVQRNVDCVIIIIIIIITPTISNVP